MSKYFGYHDYSPDGVQLVTTRDRYYKDALMDITVYRMGPGEERRFHLPEDEAAFLLLEGDVEFLWEGRSERAVRAGCFDNGAQAYALHVCKGVQVAVKAHGQSEILVQSTDNEKTFDSVFYKPADIRNEIFAKDLCGGNCVRQVTTMFDYETAPYSNMVLGEVYTRQGSWSGYPPHGHPQPEVYYYRVDKPQGFGACFVGDDVYMIKDRSFSCLTHGLSHPQVTAPGYQIYTVWMIRHFPGDPWTDRIELPEHKWLYDAKF